MPDSFVSFRYEFVSGVVSVFNDDAFYDIGLSNRSSHDGLARAFILNDGGGTTFDSGELTVVAGGVSFTGIEADNPFFQNGGAFFSRIFTTSLDIIPSARVYSPTPTPADHDFQDSDAPVFTDVYFAPNDFARFSLPVVHHLPRPPIGPAEDA
jgi:hypothetical protein